MSKATPGDRMRVHTNPAYDISVAPEDQEWAYVNPVQLNNDLITIGNEMLALADASVQAARNNQKLRLDKRKLERDQEALETQLLAADPLAPSEAKSLKTIAAAVYRRCKQVGCLVEVEKRQAEISRLEDEIDSNDTTIKSAKIYWDTAERVCNNLQSHLSYVKDERKRAYQF